MCSHESPGHLSLIHMGYFSTSPPTTYHAGSLCLQSLQGTHRWRWTSPQCRCHCSCKGLNHRRSAWHGNLRILQMKSTNEMKEHIFTWGSILFWSQLLILLGYETGPRLHQFILIKDRSISWCHSWLIHGPQLQPIFSFLANFTTHLVWSSKATFRDQGPVCIYDRYIGPKQFIKAGQIWGSVPRAACRIHFHIFGLQFQSIPCLVQTVKKQRSRLERY